ADVHDLDCDGRPEIVLAISTDLSPPSNLKVETIQLVVIEGSTGATRFAQRLLDKLDKSITFDSNRGSRLWAATADVNQDGVLDLFLPAMRPDTLRELRAFDGRSGQVLWRT